MVSKTGLQTVHVCSSYTVSSLVFMTVLVHTGTRSTLVLVFITVQGTISVTHSNAGAGAGAGAQTQGVCLQAWHARAASPDKKTARTPATSHQGRTVMAENLQDDVSCDPAGESSKGLPQDGADEAYTTKSARDLVF
jgi:hypothetical protein